MESGLFINNDLLALGISDKNGNISFANYLGEKKVFLYFLYNKVKNPPLELNDEARTLYYTGNTEILGDYLEFIDSEEENAKIFNKEYSRFEILNTIINTLFSENSDLLSDKNPEVETSPFYLILPPHIGHIAKDKILNTIQKSRKIIRTSDSLNPYVYYLLTEGKIPATGTVLFFEMNFSDIYFYLVKTSKQNNKFKIEIEEEDLVLDSKIIFEIIRMISMYLVEETAKKYSTSALNPDKKEYEIIYVMPDAQDILLELNAIDEWTSIEIEVELSDGKGGPIVIYKDKLQEKVFKAIEQIQLKKKIDYFIKKYQPETMVFSGENFNNRFIADFFENYKGCGKVKHNPDYYVNISKTVFDQNEEVDSVKANELLTGQIITLYNYNSDNGKGSIGPSEHDLKYLGEGLFEVIRSTRSLEPGMILRNMVDLWEPEKRLDFEVLKTVGFDSDKLKGKSLNFVMRPVKKIELRKWLN
ncbi:MAG: hypothetical protein DRJ05_03835 [Bacteroidetes bacterium]|nr:MAG: hypothetical protein DRJ05_03835 [Bacteroidota bacterium]